MAERNKDFPQNALPSKTSLVKKGPNLFSVFKPGFALNKLANIGSIKGALHFEIKLINYVLQACILILLVYLVSTVTFYKTDFTRKLNSIFQPKPASAKSGSGDNSLLKETGYYLNKAKTRDIFAMGAVPELEVKETKKEETEELMAITANLKVVGISWSENPDVIIEDTKLKTTYFLRTGQIFKESLKVREILKDKVILLYNESEIEVK